MDTTIPFLHLQEVALEAYESYKEEQGGANANYIPYLDGIDSNLFGLSICLPDGRTIEFGDVGYRFGIESISKVYTALLILKQYGDKELLKRIGADATGLPFNSIMAILLENEHPSTPLVNAGAIAACSLVKPIGNPNEKWQAILTNINDLCGGSLDLIDELYNSEASTDFNNRAIAWLLKSYDRIYDNPMQSLDLYTRQCSLGVTTNQLAVTAATIANSGLNPLTHQQVFIPYYTPLILSLMATVGFYERTGDWMFTTGIPAKSGVGGGVMGVLPGVMGIAAFSPRLDKSGNSVRAQLAIKYIMNSLELHLYSGKNIVIS